MGFKSRTLPYRQFCYCAVSHPLTPVTLNMTAATKTMVVNKCNWCVPNHRVTLTTTDFVFTLSFDASRVHRWDTEICLFIMLMSFTSLFFPALLRKWRENMTLFPYCEMSVGVLERTSCVSLHVSVHEGEKVLKEFLYSEQDHLPGLKRSMIGARGISNARYLMIIFSGDESMKGVQDGTLIKPIGVLSSVEKKGIKARGLYTYVFSPLCSGPRWHGSHAANTNELST